MAITNRQTTRTRTQERPVERQTPTTEAATRQEVVEQQQERSYSQDAVATPQYVAEETVNPVEGEQAAGFNQRELSKPAQETEKRPEETAQGTTTTKQVAFKAAVRTAEHADAAPQTAAADAGGYTDKPNLSDMEDTDTDQYKAASRVAESLRMDKPNLADMEEQGEEAAPNKAAENAGNGKLNPSDAPVDIKEAAERTRKLYTPLPEAPGWTPSQRQRGTKARKHHEADVKEEVSGRGMVPDGNNIRSKLVAGPTDTLGLNEVAVGVDTFAEALTQPGSTVLARLNSVIEYHNSVNQANQVRTFSPQEFAAEISEMTKTDLIQALNTIDFWVTMTKSPTTDPQSFQARVLRLHEGDGIKVNPLTVKQFNADFDGDDAAIHLDGQYVSQARTASQYLIGIEGKCLIDWDYFPRLSVVNNPKNLAAFKRIFGNQANIQELVDAWENMCMAPKNDAAAVEFVRQLALASNQSARKIDQNINRLWHFMLEAKRLTVDEIVTGASIEELDEFMELADLTETEKAEWRYYAEAKAGRLPANWAQYVIDTAGYEGDIPGKSAQFRQGTGPAKVIKRNPHIFIGPDGVHKNFADSALSLMAQAMSGKTFQEGWNKKAEAMRAYVIERAGFPGDSIYGGDLNKFMIEFARAYNEYASMVELASIETDTRYNVIDEVNKKTIDVTYNGMTQTWELGDVTFKDCVEPFIDVYGEFTMSYVFGEGFTIPKGKGSGKNSGKNRILFKNKKVINESLGSAEYRGSGLMDYAGTAYGDGVGRALYLSQTYKWGTIREFAYKNQVMYSLDKDKKASSKTDFASPDAIVDFVLAIADSRTAAVSSYETAKTKAYRGMEDIIHRYRAVRKKDGNFSHNMEILCRKYIDVLRGTHPDMFAYFGMEDIKGFEESEYGQAMLRGYDMDSVRISMTYEWRMSRVSTIQEKMEVAENEEIYARLEEQLFREQTRLASSGELWSILATITDEQFRSYCYRIKNGGETLNRKTSGKDMANMKANAKSFMIGNWETFNEFMLDYSMNGTEKRKILADLVIENNGWIKFNPNDVLYELELDPASNYSGPNVAGWEEKKGMSLKSALDELGPYISSGLKSDKVKDKSDLTFINDDGEADYELFEHAIERLRSFPRSAMAYSRRLYADAVAAASFKTYADSEKAQQQAIVDALFVGMSNSKNGTIVQELQRADNFTINTIGYDQLTKIDIIDILVHGKTRYVYDAYGRTVELSREALGINSDEDLWDFLLDNPEVSSMITPSISYVNSNGNIGYARQQQVWTVEDEIEQTLMDHPGFGAICSLFVSHSEMGQAMLSDRILVSSKRIIDNLLRMDLAKQEFIEIPGMDIKGQNEVAGLLHKYAAEAQAIAGYKYDGESDWSWIDVDKASIQSYYDVKQTLNGAKTKSSTGVEGSMSTQHGVMQLWMPSLKDEYMPVDMNTDDEIKQRLIGAPTVDGVPYDGQMETIVYAPNEDFRDATVDTRRKGNDDSPQMSFNSLWFMLKRMLSGEDHNTKAKKSGDDGTDSISKYGKWDLNETSFEDFMWGEGLQADGTIDWERRGLNNLWWDMLESGVEPELAIERIRYQLAKRLREADRALGYDGTEVYELHNYMNIARLMVVPQTAMDEEGEYQTFVIRSLEQISTRLNTVIGASMVDMKDVKTEEEAIQIKDTILKLCQEEAAQVGLESEANAKEILLGVQSFMAKKPNERTMANKRMNSYSRNMDFIQTLAQQSPDCQFLTKKQLRAVSDKICKDANGNAIYNTGAGTFFVGIADSKRYDVTKVPGATNCVLIKADATPENFEKALRDCYQYGMTALFEDPGMVENLSNDYWGQLVTSFGATGFVGLPFFNMRLNGFGHTKSATWHGDPDNFALVCEDAHCRFAYGDAVAFGTKQFLNEKVNMAHGSNLESVRLWTDRGVDMFANTREAYDGFQMEFSLVNDPQESQKIMEGDVEIDRRVQNENNIAKKVIAKSDRAILRFFQNWDGQAPFLTEAEPGQCIGFAKCKIVDYLDNNRPKYAYAPIIPFPDYRDTSRQVPRKFKVGTLDWNKEFGGVQMNWVNTAGIDNRYFKFHEGYCAANKETMVGEPVDDHLLSDGTPIDVFVSEATTSGRRLGSNRRRDTMITLLGMTYKSDRWRYNFAEDDGFLPGKPEMREAFAMSRISSEQWFGIDQLHEDPDINKWMLRVVDKCKRIGVNPSDVFANKFNGKRVNNFYEFELLIDIDHEWEDGMLKAFNHLNPDFCPNGIDDASENHLFRCCQGDDFNLGVLQMQVEWKSGEKSGYTWENVYGSFAFFGENVSMTERPSLSAADMEYQSLQMVLHGGQGTALDFVKALRYATAGTAPAAVRHKMSRKLEVKARPDGSLGAKDGKPKKPRDGKQPKTLGQSTAYGFKPGTVDAQVDKWIEGEDDQGLFFAMAQDFENGLRHFVRREGTPYEAYVDTARRVVARTLNGLLVEDRKGEKKPPKIDRPLTNEDALVINATNKVLHKLGLTDPGSGIIEE